MNNQNIIKTVAVTGAGGGLGLKLAIGFAESTAER